MCFLFMFFFFNDTATTEIYTLSLHDALPISADRRRELVFEGASLQRVQKFVDIGHQQIGGAHQLDVETGIQHRSEEHTSELQSRQYLVCRLLLEKKKKIHIDTLLRKFDRRNI